MNIFTKTGTTVAQTLALLSLFALVMGTFPFTARATIVEDVCSNLEGAQQTTPEGYTNNDGTCTEIPVDLCDNMEGTQATIPEGYTADGSACYETMTETGAELSITYPNVENNELSGEETLTANFTDDDKTEDEINWTVYAGTCDGAKTKVVAGNTNGFSAEYSYSEGEIEMYLNAQNLVNGAYCLVVDPVEQGEESDLNDAEDFTVANPVETVSGYKYEDINKNGALDEGDAPVEGWVIIAHNDALDLDVTTETDAEGYYEFALQSGDWTISEDTRSDWEQVLAEDYGYGDYELRIDDIQMDAEAPMTCEFTLYGYRSKMRESRSEYRCDFLNVRTKKAHTTGTRIIRATPAPLVLGASTTAPMCTGLYLTDYMRMGMAASSTQVLKLQVFLNAVGIVAPLTGEFGTATDAAVRIFQSRFTRDVLSPWGISDATGYVYKTTRAKINNTVCPGSEPTPTL